jgi:hypothetical protein
VAVSSVVVTVVLPLLLLGDEVACAPLSVGVGSAAWRTIGGDTDVGERERGPVSRPKGEPPRT